MVCDPDASVAGTVVKIAYSGLVVSQAFLMQVQTFIEAVLRSSNVSEAEI